MEATTTANNTNATTNTLTFNFQTKVSSIYLQIFYFDNKINIKGFTSITKKPQSLLYDILYKDIDLPQNIKGQFHCAQNLAQKIDQLRDKLRIDKDCLLIDLKDKDKSISLPLKLANKSQNATSQEEVTIKIRKKKEYSQQYGQMIQIKWHKQEKKIDLSETDVDDVQVELLCQQLPELENICLALCRQLKSVRISNCKKINVIDLRFTQVTRVQFNELPELKQLHMNECRQLKHIKIINCINVKKLKLGWTKITDDQFKLLSQQVPDIQQLSLSCCKELKIIQLENCTKIKKLDLAWTEITDAQFELLIQKLPQLESLDLSCCKLKNIRLDCCIKIKKLNLSMTRITDLKFEKLTELEEISIQECTQIKDIKLDNCKKIRKLDIRSCKISQIRVQELRKQFPNAEIRY